jgi:HEAT repeats
MAQRRKKYSKQPVVYPSIPDLESKPGEYDEPEISRQPDQIPLGNLRPGQAGSAAELRLRVESLLMRKEAPEVEAWKELGDGARTMLLQLIDDMAITNNQGLRQRLIATLGQWGVKRAIPRLGEILLTSSENPIIRAAAANALGRIADQEANSFLARAVSDREAVVRRQIALALGRVGGPDIFGHLQTLANDSSPAVASVAVEQLRAYERELGIKLNIKGKVSRARARKRKIQPASDQ